MDKIVHFEIPTANLKQAKTFYENCFNWEIREVEVPGPDYYVIHTVAVDDNGMPLERGAINGGLIPRSDTSAHPLLTIAVESLREAIEKVITHGGSVILPPEQIGSLGLYARIRDPDGNILALWEAIAHNGGYE